MILFLLPSIAHLADFRDIAQPGFFRGFPGTITWPGIAWPTLVCSKLKSGVLSVLIQKQIQTDKTVVLTIFWTCCKALLPSFPLQFSIPYGGNIVTWSITMIF